MFEFLNKLKSPSESSPPSDLNLAPGKALLPLVLFVITFVGAGIALTMQGFDKPFYQISASVAILPAIVLSTLLSREKIQATIKHFLGGAGHVNILTMVFIYLLAGAYSEVVEGIGGVEATVNFGLQFISGSMLLPGIFVISSFISFAMGTSMGTLAAMTPIAIGIAQSTGLSFPLTMGALVGGAMFGDNLSLISDTTIAAVQTQGCEMRDKFRMNFSIAIPAFLITIFILVAIGSVGVVEVVGQYEIIKILPYALVLSLAILGLNVMAVLMIGILFAGLVGFLQIDGFTIPIFTQKIYTGFNKMSEIIILSLMIGGLGEMIKQQGGMRYLIKKITRLTTIFSKNDKSRILGEIEIGSLVSVIDVCTANNTVAILISGDTASEIAKKHEISPKRSASLLDIFSCIFQGLLPYSAQILLVGSLSGISPLDIISNNYYCFILGFVCLLSIIFGYPRDSYSFNESPTPKTVSKSESKPASTLRPHSSPQIKAKTSSARQSPSKKSKTKPRSKAKTKSLPNLQSH